mmetsp:Transcript_50588/g.163914  ORF Transcript_50588/g.163914 Transcript_50588/m.163914 type:complete len:228 (-) Transcript_50588:58-741(-)
MGEQPRAHGLHPERREHVAHREARIERGQDDGVAGAVDAAEIIMAHQRSRLLVPSTAHSGGRGLVARRRRRRDAQGLVGCEEADDGTREEPRARDAGGEDHAAQRPRVQPRAGEPHVACTESLRRQQVDRWADGAHASRDGETHPQEREDDRIEVYGRFVALICQVPDDRLVCQHLPHSQTRDQRTRQSDGHEKPQLMDLVYGRLGGHVGRREGHRRLHGSSVGERI